MGVTNYKLLRWPVSQGINGAVIIYNGPLLTYTDSSLTTGAYGYAVAGEDDKGKDLCISYWVQVDFDAGTVTYENTPVDNSIIGVSTVGSSTIA